MSGEEKKNDNIDLKLSASLSRFGIKGRGRGTTPARLPSLKPARDLTLGGTPKRTFTPNIVSRSVKKEEAHDGRGPRSGGSQRGFRGKRGRGGRGRGEIISSSGIFSQGPAVQQTLASVFTGGYGGGFGGGGGGGGGGGFGGGGGGSGTSVVGSLKGELEEELISDKVFEMLKDEGKIELNEDEMKLGNLAPITLPLASRLTQKIKEEQKIENADITDTDEKAAEVDLDEKKPLPKKSVITKNSEAISEVNLTDLFKDNNPNGQLMFFQFPDTLPIKPLAHDDPTVKMEPGVLSETEKINEETIEEQLKDFTFQNVSEGVIGKLQIHESGKVKIRLGNVLLDVSMGTPCGFLQDLISVHTDKTPAEMISLGHIDYRLIAVPDYSSLLGSVDT